MLKFPLPLPEKHCCKNFLCICDCMCVHVTGKILMLFDTDGILIGLGLMVQYPHCLPNGEKLLR